ncbi:RdgB/HAM1 family non-canonical purine NTP pyrophosphatase [Stratiformator vulcanicus]|uniref:dITP/XTP pyrophosphatase n=1 Tax=Stratiformator vulcanicus TaxID=2527980 RepID=A0A517R5I4_9PLAN|nr:RdgB/HAM1 family non-canonical purine NTP pyrophosphatase [Stratiformator vulcanicus]QDT39093.1 Non-canonical purine NTP pyrophosphatase [Stratiformator vulcanicus]
MTSIIIASRNRGKIVEIEDLLAPYGFEIQCVADFPDVPEAVEDGETFDENAAKKATEVANHLGCWAIGEDSGLCVDALKGRPGIFSARFAGEQSDDQTNNQKLIDELDGVADAKRGAEYRCHVALADPSGQIRLTSQGRCRGRITTQPRGENGFGYDPYFEIRELHRTFGELPKVVKRHLSHRSRAFRHMAPRLAGVVISTDSARTG